MVQYYIFEGVVQLELFTETKTASFEKHRSATQIE